MENKSTVELHRELSERLACLSEKVDPIHATEIMQIFQSVFVKFDLEPSQFKAVVDYFIWFHYENDN